MTQKKESWTNNMPLHYKDTRLHHITSQHITPHVSGASRGLGMILWFKLLLTSNLFSAVVSNLLCIIKIKPADFIKGASGSSADARASIWKMWA